jgi:hypothetical protein
VYNAAKSVPKTVNKNIKSLKQGEDMEGGRMGSDASTYTPKRFMKGGRMPTQPDVIDNGVRGPSMGGRGVKGSQEAKNFMAKLRAMKKKK